MTCFCLVQSNASVFHPTTCSDPLKTGTSCNITNTPCEVIKPCLNNGSCFNDINTTRAYFCSCLNGFTGSQCQFDSSKICLNNGNTTPLSLSQSFIFSVSYLHVGTCEKLMNGTYTCQCAVGWEGSACEKRLNYCANVTCENQGVCRSRTSTYECLCLGESYSGRHCETVSKETVILRTVASSISFTLISIISGCALFIVMMDVLKYVFGVDVAKVEEKDRRPRRRHRRPKHLHIIHYVYVNRRAT